MAPQLKKLTISNCVKITDAGLANLQGMPLLQDLLVGGSGISGRDFTPLAPMKNLKANLMDGEQFKGNDASMDALKALLPNCEVVILRG